MPQEVWREQGPEWEALQVQLSGQVTLGQVTSPLTGGLLGCPLQCVLGGWWWSVLHVITHINCLLTGLAHSQGKDSGNAVVVDISVITHTWTSAVYVRCKDWDKRRCHIDWRPPHYPTTGGTRHGYVLRQCPGETSPSRVRRWQGPAEWFSSWVLMPVHPVKFQLHHLLAVPQFPWLWNGEHNSFLLIESAVCTVSSYHSFMGNGTVFGSPVTQADIWWRQ